MKWIRLSSTIHLACRLPISEPLRLGLKEDLLRGARTPSKCNNQRVRVVFSFFDRVEIWFADQRSSFVNILFLAMRPSLEHVRMGQVGQHSFQIPGVEILFTHCFGLES